MVLHGWKQIAQYLGCGIRTAQRWESECSLPVTRPRNHLRSPVLAQSEALDAWAGGVGPGAGDQWEARWARLERDIEMLKRQIMLLGADVLPEPERTAAKRAPANPVEGGNPRQLGARAPAFDA